MIKTLFSRTTLLVAAGTLVWGGMLSAQPVVHHMTEVHYLPPINAEEVHRSHQAELLAPMGAGSGSSTSTPTPQPAYIGKGVTLHITNTFPREGERVIVDMIALEDQAPFTITGHLTTYPSYNSPQREDYFTPTVCTGQGYCLAGMRAYDHAEVFSTQISAADAFGPRALDFAIYDYKTGQLRQQIYVYYYVQSAALSQSRLGYWIDTAQIIQAPTGNYVLFTGRFPQAELMSVWSGSVTGGYASYNPGVYSGDGKTVAVSLGWSMSVEMPVDFVFMSVPARISWGFNGVIPPLDPIPTPTSRP